MYYLKADDIGQLFKLEPAAPGVLTRIAQVQWDEAVFEGALRYEYKTGLEVAREAIDALRLQGRPDEDWWKLPEVVAHPETWGHPASQAAPAVAPQPATAHAGQL